MRAAAGVLDREYALPVPVCWGAWKETGRRAVGTLCLWCATDASGAQKTRPGWAPVAVVINEPQLFPDSSVNWVGSLSKIYIKAEQASQLLPHGSRVHTFIRAFGWFGGYVDRVRILDVLHSAAEMEISPDAALFDHHMVVDVEGVATYIDTDARVLRRLFPHLASGRRIPIDVR